MFSISIAKNEEFLASVPMQRTAFAWLKMQFVLPKSTLTLYTHTHMYRTLEAPRNMEIESKIVYQVPAHHTNHLLLILLIKYMHCNEGLAWSACSLIHPHRPTQHCYFFMLVLMLVLLGLKIRGDRGVKPPW